MQPIYSEIFLPDVPILYLFLAFVPLYVMVRLIIRIIGSFIG